MPADLGDMLIAMLPRLRRYGLALARNGDIADELVQATCERALAARMLDDPGRLDAWLFRILRNLWLDRLRRTKTRGQEEPAHEHETLAAPGAEALPERRLLLAAVAREIDALPEEQRELLLLVCVEELSYREAAQVLELPIGTVMSRLARARTRLSERVALAPGEI